MASSEVVSKNNMFKSRCSLRYKSRQRSNNCECRRRSNCRKTTLFASFATTFSTALSSFATATAASTIPAVVVDSSRRHLRSANNRFPPNNNLLRQRQHGEEEEELDLKKSNDDDARTIVPLHPFSLQLSNLPPTSPMLATDTALNNNYIDGISSSSNNAHPAMNTPAMNNLLEYISDVGTRAFSQSIAYGERFEEWDVGTVSIMGGGTDGVSGEFVFSRAASETPSSSSSSSSSPSPLSGGEMVGASIGHNGTVTFKDMYWEDVPDSRELTQYLVQAMNVDANKAGLLKKLHPIVCDAGDLIGNTCNVELEVMTSDDAIFMKEDGVVTTVEVDDAKYDVTAMGENELIIDSEYPMDDTNVSEETTSVNPFDATSPQDEVTTESALGSTSGSELATGPKSDPASLENASRDEPPNDETTNANIDLVDTRIDILDVNSPTTGTVIAAATAAQDPSSQGGSNNDNSSLLPVIIPVVAGASIVALLVAGLLYRRRRKRQEAREDELLRHAHENIRGWNTSLEAKPRNPQPRQDDVVRSSKSLCGGRWTTTVKNDSSTAATAGASVAATSLAATAGSTPATKSIDNILEEFSDSDSSFISDSSIATSDSEQQQQRTGSLCSGLSGRIGGSLSPSPFDDVGRMGSRLSACGIASDGGYLPDSLQKAAGNSSSSPVSPNSLQKQESFEGTHRTISAMHQLHLKKDILHVACDAHDTTASAANNTNGKDNAAASAERGEYGVSRTISPQKNTSMMEKQRLAEEMSLSPSGRYQMRKGNELPTAASWKDDNGKRQEMMKKQQRNRATKMKKQRNRVNRDCESSNPLKVPTGFERSKSVHLVSWSSSGNSISSSGDDSKGAFPRAYV